MEIILVNKVKFRALGQCYFINPGHCLLDNMMYDLCLGAGEVMVIIDSGHYYEFAGIII